MITRKGLWVGISLFLFVGLALLALSRGSAAAEKLKFATGIRVSPLNNAPMGAAAK